MSAVEMGVQMAVQVKICGITSAEDARAAIELGATMLGVNFYAPSPRCVALTQAREIAEAVGGRARLVGVFVNMNVEDVLRTARAVPLDAVQLHGDETRMECEAVAAEFPLIRALKVDTYFERRVFEQFMPRIVSPSAEGLNMEPAHWDLLLDTPCADRGGSGESFRWTDVRWDWLRERLPESKIYLAGGLDANNVGEAIRIVHPDVVDVCSGVEQTKRTKSVSRMRAFVAAVKAAEGQER
jgi:phosphoribosylanthranilate isomerase